MEKARMMRAKLQVGMVQEHFSKDHPNGEPYKSMETVTMHAVCKSTPYGEDGLDDDNTYARWSPGASLSINIANPALFGAHKVGDKFYVDFTPAE